MTTTKERKMKVYRVRVEYTARGYVEVEATSEDEARELAQGEISPTAPFELADWSIESVREVESS